MHPLINDLTKLDENELHKKFGELQKRMIQAHQFGPQNLIPQLQLLMDDYRLEIQRRNQKQMEALAEKTKKSNQDMDGIIDIK
jgi:hypothetical protein